MRFPAQEPALRHARITDIEVIRAQAPQGFENSEDHVKLTTARVPGVRVDMPRDDFETVVGTYQMFETPASNHPAVLDAWHELRLQAQRYQLIVAMTQNEKTQ